MNAMLDRTLFVGLSRLAPGVDRAALGAKLDEHLAFMIGLEERGILFASGPFRDAAGNTGEGLTIVRAPSLADAEALLDREPFALAGLRTWEVREWHLMEGVIQISLTASTQRGALP